METDFEKAREEFDKESTAYTLLHKSVDHQWYSYVGNPIQISYNERNLTITSGTCFGLKPSAFGYNMETQVFHEGPIPINFRDGYTLTKLSRPMSKREARFTKTT